jgi:D-galactarolactone cycloisomerase
MKVRAIEAIPLRYEIPTGAYGSARGLVSARTTCLVRMEADGGLVGLGEAFGPPRVMVAHVGELAPVFLGQDPFDHERLWGVATNGRYHWGRTGLHIAALSGLEVACWDLMGKALGLPAAKLLGGWNRDDVRAYASTGYFTERPDGFRRSIEQAAAEGFRLIKIKCGDGIRSDLERIDLTYEIAGKDAGVMVDLNGNYTADLALRLAPELEARGVLWLEEPVPPEDLDGYARLRDGSRVPLASGEADALRVGFRELVSRRLVDIVQPDVTTCGGLAEAKAIVRMAQTWNLRFSPHVWGGAVALAAALQLCAATPLHPHVTREAAPLLFEYDRGLNALRDELLATPIEVAGDRIRIPKGPGLGVEVDWAAVERFRMDRGD